MLSVRFWREGVRQRPASAQIKRVHRHEGASPGGRARAGGRGAVALAMVSLELESSFRISEDGRRYVGGCCREWGEDDDDVG